MTGTFRSTQTGVLERNIKKNNWRARELERARVREKKGREKNEG